MAILITGATGFLGRALVERYGQDNSEDWIKSNLVLLGHSEKRADFLRRKYNTKVFVGDVGIVCVHCLNSLGISSNVIVDFIFNCRLANFFRSFKTFF